MRHYRHRDEGGTLRAIYNEDVMRELVFQITGMWRPYKTADGPYLRCYEVTADQKITLHKDALQIMLWKGDKILEMND